VNNNQVYRLNSGSSPLCSKPRRKFVQTSYALKSQFIGLIFLSLRVKTMLIQSRIASSESHNIRTRTSSAPSVKSTLSWIGHSRSFKVILIGAGRNPERCVVVMWRCPVRKAFEYLQMVYIARN